MKSENRFILMTVWLCLALKISAQVNVDSIRQMLVQINKSSPSYTTDTSKVNTLNSLAWQLANSQTDSAIQLTTEALQLATEVKFETGIANAHNNLGWFAYIKVRYAEALAHYNIGYETWERIAPGGEKGAAILANIGLVYADEGDYPRALESYFKALKVLETKDKRRASIIMGNVGIVYRNEKNYAKALEFYLRALDISKELGIKKNIARHLGNIAIVYQDLGEYAKAREYTMEAMKTDEASGNKNGVARHLVNLASLWQTQGLKSKDPKIKKENYRLALEYYNKVLEMESDLKNKKIIAITTGNIGTMYSEEKNYAEAETYLLKAIAICDEISILNEKRQFEIVISEMYEKTGRPAEALKHYKIFTALKDSMTNEENIRSQTRSEMNYSFDKQQALQKAEQEKKDTVTRIIIYSVSSGLLLLLVLSVFIFRSYRLKKKAHKEISKQKQIIEEKQKEILDSIYYARRIQRSLLTSEKYIERNLAKMNK